MKQLLFAALALTLVACDTESTTDPAAQSEALRALDASREVWDAMRDEAGGHYWYRADRSSVTQWTSSTWIEVEAGAVVQVTTEARDDGGTVREAVADFVDFAPSLTLDALYDRCADVLRDGGDLTFETDDSGLIRECWAWPEGCLDDCGRGVSVNAFGVGAMVR